MQRLLHHRQQVSRQHLHLHFVPQPGAETRERAHRVIFAPLEAPVDERLDAPPQRLEEGGDR